MVLQLIICLCYPQILQEFTRFFWKNWIWTSRDVFIFKLVLVGIQAAPFFCKYPAISPPTPQKKLFGYKYMWNFWTCKSKVYIHLHVPSSKVKNSPKFIICKKFFYERLRKPDPARENPFKKSWTYVIPKSYPPWDIHTLLVNLSHNNMRRNEL